MDFVNFGNLRFEDRDKLEEVLKTYFKKVPFEIESYRDQRLRYHFGERYDYRKNAIDWDYNFNLKEIVSLLFIH